MSHIQNNIFQALSLLKDESLQLIDVFDVHGKKTITLSSHSSLTYLVVARDTDIDINFITQ